MDSSAVRGHKFELEIAKLLRAAGFEVTLNAGAAAPRQTDLFAQGQSLDLLVEAKDRRRKVDVSDVDALRARLSRTASDVVGVIFSTSGLTRGATKAIEVDRTREVLIFTGPEIDQLRLNLASLSNLLDRKRNELRVHGRVWFGSPSHRDFLKVQLPLGAIEFRIDDQVSPYFESKSTFSATSYALQIPDSGWGTFGGEGARLSIKLSAYSIEDLRNIFGYLHQKFGLSNAGMFSIRQTGGVWYGAGAENFLRELERPRQRYAKHSFAAVHHSEEARYFDQFRNGWIEISCQQTIDSELLDSGRLLRSELVIQLPGVPVDSSPFVDLCRYTGNDWANFEYLANRMTFGRRLARRPALCPVGIVMSKARFLSDEEEESSVCGIIAKNPFYKKSLPRELSTDELPSLNELTETELLLCSLRHWHEVSYKVSAYRLEGVEVTVAGAGVVVRPVGNWDDA
ncbi:restriction endonuclease [Bradyrhizobium guangxiense]